jgi:quercetin dioxygenase-like cupin family protein
LKRGHECETTLAGGSVGKCAIAIKLEETVNETKRASFCLRHGGAVTSINTFVRGNAVRYFLALILVAVNIFSDLAIAQGVAPEPILPGSLQWSSPPNMSGIKGAWVLGAEQKQGLYILRVKLSSGAMIPPHTHPDERNTTVLTGTIYVGFGENFDEDKVVAVPAGAVYIAPANVPHYVWAKEGDAIYQEAGTGPTRTLFIDR